MVEQVLTTKYAIVEDGGRQYRVAVGDEFEVDLRLVPKGSAIELGPVLAYRDETGLQLGRPTLPDYCVIAEVRGVVLGPKIIVQKFKRRKRYRRKRGHRQLYSRVRITYVGPRSGAPVPPAAVN
ncbi:MAG: 50S ribosomal protein L21 [Thermoguttaceae bacterium]|nr:50S ribosomal protein L21 [Thermoguttaceae bacterium]MDW8079372.1 50S ribosomal protein L21 [Thermoguttaceae bacterium]